MHKPLLSVAQLRKVPKQFSWVDQRLVREHYMDALSHPACALYLFLLTVADAQGLSYYSEPALCRRLSMSETTLHQARQELIAGALVAYQRPLYQVLALEGPPQVPKPQAPQMTPDDDPVDIKDVFKHIWEALS